MARYVFDFGITPEDVAAELGVLSTEVTITREGSRVLIDVPADLDVAGEGKLDYLMKLAKSRGKEA